MDLHLPDLSNAKIITCTVEGILEDEDVRHLLFKSKVEDGEVVDSPHEMTRLSSKVEDNPHDLKRIKEKHHSVARLVASGLTQTMVANLSGYNEQYLSVLLNNPSMVELVTLYRIQYGKSAEIITEKLRTVGTMALERLEERLPEMDDNSLIQTAKLGLDRAGHGPQSVVHSVSETHLFDHTELSRMNAEARRGSASYIVPVEEVRRALPKPAEDSDENS